MREDIPWVDPRDIKNLGRGKFLVNCIYISGSFFYDLTIMLS